MSNIQEKSEQYAREKLGNWCHITHSAYDTSQCTNGEVSAQDYTAGYNEAMAQPKHIFDGVAKVGEVRRFEGELVDVVDVAENEPSTCTNCILFNVRAVADCSVLTGCGINNVKYIKR